MPGETYDRKTCLGLSFEKSELFPTGGKFIKSDGKRSKPSGK
jgi:hypothetical protein